MFEQQYEDYLIRQFSKNQAVLFLGSGFSTIGKNKLVENLPIGNHLAKKIWEFLYTEPFDGKSSLKLLFQALIQSSKGHDNICRFLQDNLLVHDFPAICNVLTHVYWHRIYTTNIDDIVDKIYHNNGNVYLHPIVSPKDDPTDRDQTLEKIQIVHLNGKLSKGAPCELNELIFATEQYAQNANIHHPLYAQFVREYATHCTIFIGTSIEEELFWQYIEERKFRRKEIPDELRLKSFLIVPKISLPQRAVLSKYNIIPIEATAEDFLNWIDKIKSSLPSKMQILKDILPITSTLFKLDDYRVNKKSLNQFALSFEEIPDVHYTSEQSYFLLGASPRWSDIFNDLDAPRTISKDIKLKIDDLIKNNSSLKILALLGSAGCGKSTILRRLALTLKQEGRKVYFTNSENILSPEDLSDALTSFDEKVILVCDYSPVLISKLHLYVKALEKLSEPPIIIITSRTNDFDRIAGKHTAILEIVEFEMHDLDSQEILDIISVLEKDNKPGKLRGLALVEKVKLFEQVAKKQILVAMREATLGEKFDKIIEDEFLKIVPEEAKMLCLCTALATDAGHRISKEEFVACSSETPADALYYLKRNLKNIVIADGIGDNNLSIRHRIIAEKYVYNCSDKEKLKQAYIRLLQVLCINVKNRRTYKGFNLYKDLINHKRIYARFSKKIDDARFIFEEMSSYLKDDFQFWHQYGTLELYGGDLDLAENYLLQAQSLNPDDPIITNSFGNLYLRKAIEAPNYQYSFQFYEEGGKILEEQIEYYGNSDPYCYHIYCAQVYNWIKRWIKNDEIKKERLNELLKVSKQSILLHPKHYKLDIVNKAIRRALLNLAIAKDERPEDPIIYSEH